MTLLSIENLHKVYQREILKGLHLSLNEGEFISIVGASGSGKTTLMNIIGLLEMFQSGNYFFKGKPIVTDFDRSRVRRDELGFIFQSFHLLSTLNVQENILLPFQYSTAQGRDFQPLVEQLQIDHLLEQYPDQLSGGERQRVAIARALITNPSLLLADEPTGNLDGVNRDRVMDILKHEHKNGKSVILITHDPNAALEAQTRYLLRDGVLYETP